MREYCRAFFEYIRSDKGQREITSYYRFFFFDEFQDISSIQYEILMEFAKKGCVVTVVGDDA